MKTRTTWNSKYEARNYHLSQQKKQTLLWKQPVREDLQMPAEWENFLVHGIALEESLGWKHCINIKDAYCIAQGLCPGLHFMFFNTCNTTSLATINKNWDTRKAEQPLLMRAIWLHAAWNLTWLAAWLHGCWLCLVEIGAKGEEAEGRNGNILSSGR